MPKIEDPEFGTIVVRKSRLARSIRLSIAPNGTIRISVPTRTPLFMIKRTISASRISIRKMLADHEFKIYLDGMRVGKSHTIHATHGNKLKAVRINQIIRVTYPQTIAIEDARVQRTIRDTVVSALRIESTHYLPKRLNYLADMHGFNYTKVRFSHASSRWGSCSSNGTISLNIALMNLPFELIDYVVLHELCHTQEMNHSQAFWKKMYAVCPDFTMYRKNLKKFSPVC